MKKINIIILFIIGVIASFYITKSVLNEESEPVTEKTNKKSVDSTALANATGNTQPVEDPNPQPTEEHKSQPDKKSKAQPAEDTKSQSVEKSKSEQGREPVKISLSEVKQLIVKGTYEKDRRISKSYKIEYVDVNDDDMDGLQQNLTFVQQQVDYENWRDFDVVGIDFDNKGRVNLIKIQPVY